MIKFPINVNFQINLRKFFYLINNEVWEKLKRLDVDLFCKFVG